MTPFSRRESAKDKAGGGYFGEDGWKTNSLKSKFLSVLKRISGVRIGAWQDNGIFFLENNEKFHNPSFFSLFGRRNQ